MAACLLAACACLMVLSCYHCFLNDVSVVKLSSPFHWHILDNLKYPLCYTAVSPPTMSHPDVVFNKPVIFSQDQTTKQASSTTIIKKNRLNQSGLKVNPQISSGRS